VVAILRVGSLAPNGLPARIVLAIVTSAGILYASLAPVIVSGLMQSPSFTGESAGYVFSVNMYGSAFGGFLIIFVVERLNWRWAAAILLVLIIGLDLLSAFLDSATQLYVVRFLHGVVGGGLIGVGMAVIARIANPERTFALLIVIQLVLGGVVTAALTPVLSELGVRPVWLFLMGFSILALLLLPLLGEYPLKDTLAAVDGSSRRAGWLPVLLIMAAVFVFQAGEMGAFMYVIELGSSYDFDIGFVSLVVAASLWIGGPAALVVNWWSTRNGRLVPVGLGMILTTVSVALLLVPETTTYLMANIGFGIFFSLSIPYLLGIASEMDNTGQMAAIGGFINSLGLASGPAFAAGLVGEGSLQRVVIFAVAALVLSTLLMIQPARMLDRKSKHGRAVW